jgi:hypothetical protein
MQDDSAAGSRLVFSNERPAYSIYPPAIVRHVLFRLHAGGPDGAFGEAEQRERSGALRRIVAEHLNMIRDVYGPCDDRIEIVLDPGDADGRFKFASSRSIHFEVAGADRFGYRLRIRADIYAELFTVTYLVDEVGRHGASEVQRKFARLPREPEAIDWLFDQVWESDDFPAHRVIRDWTRQRDDPADSRRIGELVADFRAVVLFPREEWNLGDPSLEFGRIAISSETQIAPEILAFASEHQPLIRHVAGSHHEGGEPILCGMAGGQALYVAELGQWGVKAQSINPIRLLLIYAGHSHAQMGRLMRRLHVLGELRHAAVLDWDLSSVGSDKDLRTASMRLRELSDRVDRATLDTATDIGGILRDFAQISMGVEGGLSYRIERSRSYASSFLDTLPHLRITRIAGWQPYDDFINRYIGLLFGRIHRIGLQYDELGRRIDRLIDKERGNRLETYQEAVQRTLVHLDALIYEMRKDADRQLDLLGNAELFAIIFGIYYLGSILRYAVYETEHHIIVIGGWTATLFGRPLDYDMAWFILAGGLSLYLGFRLFRTMLRRRAEKKNSEGDTN